jgi:hypothetical protein
MEFDCVSCQVQACEACPKGRRSTDEELLERVTSLEMTVRMLGARINKASTAAVKSEL